MPESQLFAFMLTRSTITQGPLPTPCFLWNGYRTPRGYGQIGFRGKMKKLHRVVWILKRGQIPKGLEVCHECDIPACFNPEHLFVGTHGDNMRDAAKKKRLKHRKGSLHPMSKLTDDQVLAIRNEYNPPLVTRRILAEKYGVSRNTIACITQRRNWTHI